MRLRRQGRTLFACALHARPFQIIDLKYFSAGSLDSNEEPRFEMSIDFVEIVSEQNLALVTT